MSGFDALIAARKRARPPLEIRGVPVAGVVSWNMNDTCNYRCSYCSQRFNPERTYRLEEIERYLAAFAALPGRWEVKLSGGEPFRQPGLVEIVSGLVEAGHFVSVQTNFSASDAKLAAFLEATRGALSVFSASLHLEYADADGFIDKWRRVVAPVLEADGGHFNVTSVATPSRLVELRDEVAPRFRAAGVRFKVQPEKLHGEVRAYTEAERAIIEALGGHNQTGAMANDFLGRLCWSGAAYLVIKSDGTAWRCYPASRKGGRYAKLGSFVDGIDLLDGPRVCPYSYCNCTVPINRGMIEGVKPRPEA